MPARRAYSAGMPIGKSKPTATPSPFARSRSRCSKLPGVPTGSGLAMWYRRPPLSSATHIHCFRGSDPQSAWAITRGSGVERSWIVVHSGTEDRADFASPEIHPIHSSGSSDPVIRSSRPFVPVPPRSDTNPL